LTSSPGLLTGATERSMRPCISWSTAEHLSSLPVDGRAGYVTELDRLASVLAYLVTRPTFPTTLLVRTARRLEQRDPKSATAALLGDA